MTVPNDPTSPDPAAPPPQGPSDGPTPPPPPPASTTPPGGAQPPPGYQPPPSYSSPQGFPAAPPPAAQYGYGQVGTPTPGMYLDQGSGLMVPNGTQLAPVG